MSAKHLIIEPGNPFEYSEEELHDLVTSVESEVADDVIVSTYLRREDGYGVTLYEVIAVWDLAAQVVGNTAIIGGPFYAAARWAQKRWHNDKKENPDERPAPRSVSLYGPDGTEIRSVIIDEPDGDIQDQPPSERKRDLPPSSGARS